LGHHSYPQKLCGSGAQWSNKSLQQCSFYGIQQNCHFGGRSHLSSGRAVRLPGGNVTSKTKVPELPTFVGSENKMQLHNWLSQIALYCLASGITTDNQKIICALTCLCAPASTYMKSYYDKVQAGQSVGSWGNFAQELKIIYRQ